LLPWLHAGVMVTCKMVKVIDNHESSLQSSVIDLHSVYCANHGVA